MKFVYNNVSVTMTTNIIRISVTPYKEDFIWFIVKFIIFLPSKNGPHTHNKKIITNQFYRTSQGVIDDLSSPTIFIMDIINGSLND